MEPVVFEFVNLRQAAMDEISATFFLALSFYEKGKRVLILACDQNQARQLDEALWAYEPSSFLPHAIVNETSENDEPVLIDLDWAKNPNKADVLIMLKHLESPPIESFGHLIQFVPLEEGAMLTASRERYRQFRARKDISLKHTVKVR